jgi:hypothetical protein
LKKPIVGNKHAVVVTDEEARALSEVNWVGHVVRQLRQLLQAAADAERRAGEVSDSGAGRSPVDGRH